MLPFVLFKANRILPGDPRSVAEVLPAWGAVGFYLALILVAAVAIVHRRCPRAAGLCVDRASPWLRWRLPPQATR